MTVLFCTACGTRNRRGVPDCRRCNSPLVSYEKVNTAQWEEVDAANLNIDELVRPRVWQQIKQHPVYTGSAMLGFVILVAGLVWLITYFNRPPECIEYQGFDCTAIVLERRIRVPAVEDLEREANNLTIEDLNYPQAEILDWMRLLVISRRVDGTMPILNLIDNAIGDTNSPEVCSDVFKCLAVPSDMDINYDGLSGQAGLTAEGVVRTLSLASSSQAFPIFTMWGRVPAGLPPDFEAVASFQEIHLISRLTDQRPALVAIANQFRSELLRAGLSIRVRVLPEAHSRSSSISAARIIQSLDSRSLRLDNSLISLELQSDSREVVWRASYSATIEHVVDAVRRRLSSNARSIVVADCLQHQVTETADRVSGGAEIEVVCYESVRFQELVSAGDSATQWLLISSQREAEIVSVVDAVVKNSPLLVLRL